MKAAPRHCGLEEDSNPYEILGIKNCSHDRKEIQRKGRVLKAATHPDKNYGNSLAHRSSVIASSGTELLMDADKKQECDHWLNIRQLCFRKTRDSEEAKFLKRFFRQKNELDRARRINRWKTSLESAFTTLKNLPRSYSAKASNLVSQTYAYQLGRVRKTYRKLGRWFGRIPYGGKPTRRSKQPVKTLTRPTGTWDVAGPEAVRKASTANEFPITSPPKRTYSITETRTITETEVKTETVTVEAFGVNVRDYARDIEQIVRKIDPRYVGAAGIFVACVAGGWYLVNRRIHRQRQAVEHPQVDDQDVLMADGDELNDLSQDERSDPDEGDREGTDNEDNQGNEDDFEDQVDEDESDRGDTDEGDEDGDNGNNDDDDQDRGAIGIHAGFDTDDGSNVSSSGENDDNHTDEAMKGVEDAPENESEDTGDGEDEDEDQDEDKGEADEVKSSVDDDMTATPLAASKPKPAASQTKDLSVSKTPVRRSLRIIAKSAQH